jgi:tetratricopeptide (TPR) repeat protein
MNDYPAAYDAIKNASNFSSVQDITVRFNQGVIEERLLKYKDAVDSYNAVLEMDPANVKALFNKGSIYWNHYRLNESLEAYNQVVSIDPEFSDAWFYRGLVLKELNQINESAESFIHAADLKPQDRMYRAYADRYAQMLSGGVNPRPTFPIPLSWSVPVTLILGLLFVWKKKDQR